jgi:hypothetical protein
VVGIFHAAGGERGGGYDNGAMDCFHVDREKPRLFFVGLSNVKLQKKSFTVLHFEENVYICSSQKPKN